MPVDLIEQPGRQDTRQRTGSSARGDGQADPVDGLVEDPAGPHRIMASEPAHNRQPLPRLELPHFAGVGTQACADL